MIASSREGTRTLSKDRVVWCDRGWYPFYYGFCPSEDAWKRQMKKFNCSNEPYPKSHGATTSFTNKRGELSILVTVSDQPTSPDALMGLLVHESVHVKQRLLENIGEDKLSPEAEAYAVQAIFMCLMDAYAKTRGQPTP